MITADNDTLQGRALVRGFVTCAAEFYRLTHDGDAVRTVLRDAGITLAIARKASAQPYDVGALAQAGVP